MFFYRTYLVLTCLNCVCGRLAFGFMSWSDLGYYRHWKKIKLINVDKMMDLCWEMFLTVLLGRNPCSGANRCIWCVNHYFMSVRWPQDHLFTSTELPVRTDCWWRRRMVHRKFICSMWKQKFVLDACFLFCVV